MVTITLKEGQLSLAEMRAALKTPLQVKLDPGCLSRIETSAKTVDSVLEQEQTAVSYTHLTLPTKDSV